MYYEVQYLHTNSAEKIRNPVFPYVSICISYIIIKPKYALVTTKSLNLNNRFPNAINLGIPRSENSSSNHNVALKQMQDNRHTPTYASTQTGYTGLG